MKIQVLSDLHIEFAPDNPDWCRIEPTDADVIILAGDIWTGTKGLQWAVSESERLGKPIIYVAGNHEFYNYEMPALLKAMSEAVEGAQVHFLENESVVIEGVRFLGCTLWTDYLADPATSQHACMSASAGALNDHRLIRLDAVDSFLPEDALRLHKNSKCWLEAELPRKVDGPTVVITHHAPTPAAQNHHYPLNPLTGAFWSDLEYLMDGNQSAAWIFGHTHHCVDNTVNGVRLISNQRGYPGDDTGGFDPIKTIHI